MLNGINNISKASNIFAEMEKFGVKQIPIAATEQKADTLELSNKKPMSKKKKIIIGTSIAVGVALAIIAFIKRKEIGTFLKKIFKKDLTKEERNARKYEEEIKNLQEKFRTKTDNSSLQTSPIATSTKTVDSEVHSIKSDSKIYQPSIKSDVNENESLYNSRIFDEILGSKSNTNTNPSQQLYVGRDVSTNPNLCFGEFPNDTIPFDEYQRQQEEIFNDYIIMDSLWNIFNPDSISGGDIFPELDFGDML